MTIIKKLILSVMILSSTSLFAAGFDTPKEAFDFYFKLAEKAKIYKDKNGHYNKKHINELAPHMWSKRNPSQDAKLRISSLRSYIVRTQNAYRGKDPLVVNLRVEKPYFLRGEKSEGILTIPYTYFKQQSSREVNRFKIRAKKIGEKIKWFIY